MCVCDHDDVNNKDSKVVILKSSVNLTTQEQPTLCPYYTTTIQKYSLTSSALVPYSRKIRHSHTNTNLLVQLLHAHQVKRLNAEEERGEGGGEGRRGEGRRGEGRRGEGRRGEGRGREDRKGGEERIGEEKGDERREAKRENI